MLARLWRRLAFWLAYRETIEALDALDDRLLADLGIRPDERAGWAKQRLLGQRAKDTCRPPIIRTDRPARIWSHRPVPNR